MLSMNARILNGRESRIVLIRNVKMVLVSKMNKKGARPEYRTLVQIILFAAITLAIAIPACVKLTNWWTEKPRTGTSKSLDTIRIEVNNLYGRKEIPVYVDESHVIKIFNVGDPERPEFEGCKKQKDKSCICVCKTSTCNIDEDEVNLCKAFDGDYFGTSYPITPYIVEEKAQLQNCIFFFDEKVTKKIVLQGCGKINQK
jgi:hypothetical protein